MSGSLAPSGRRGRSGAPVLVDLAARLRSALDVSSGRIDIAGCLAVAEHLETYALEARLPRWLAAGASLRGEGHALLRLGQLIERRVPGLRSSRARLLALLVCHAGSVVSYDHLSEQARCGPGSLRVLVSTIRVALRDAGLPDAISSHRSAGYLLSAEAAEALLDALQVPDPSNVPSKPGKTKTVDRRARRTPLAG